MIPLRVVHWICKILLYFSIYVDVRIDLGVHAMAFTGFFYFSTEYKNSSSKGLVQGLHGIIN